MSIFVKFPKIRSFEYICEKMRDQPESAHSTSYGAKVKLNGRNVAVQLSTAGTVTAQEKMRDLSIDDDKFGFCQWVTENKDAWSAAHRASGSCSLGWDQKNALVFGEWAGNIVERDPPDAVTLLPETYFFVFGVFVEGMFVCDPAKIASIVPNLPNVRVLPWFIAPQEASMAVDFRDETSTERFAGYISDVVEAMESEDPYIKAEFGVSGPAEGLVLTSKGGEHGVSMQEFGELTFKAKVKSHWVHRTTRPAVTRVTVPHDISQFIYKFVTDRRCGQGLSEACDGVAERTKVDKLVAWVEKDVKKESDYERQRMGVEWKLLSRHVTIAATKWFFEKCGK